MIIVEMKKHFQLRAIEWWSAAVMASWGFWVIAWPSMFQDNAACHALLAYAPQQLWGLAALVCGGLRTCALFVNGLWYRTPAIRWACAMGSIFIWFSITAAFISSPIINMGPIIYGWLVLADMYSAFRSASDFIEAEAQRKLKDLAVAQMPTSDENSNVRRIPAR